MKHLTWNSENKLRIVQFTDLHLEHDKEACNDTLALMNTVLDCEKPDFVALTGDIVIGDKNLKLLDQAMAPMIKRKIPWGYVFGNHDDEWGASKKDLFEKVSTMEYSMMFNDDDSISGLGNYYLPIQNQEGDSSWVLYFIDSNAYNANERLGGYDYIQPNQVDWYASTAKRLSQTLGEHAALSFFHIPLPEYHEVWNEHVCYGNRYEHVCAPRQNSGLFSAMLNAGNMRGVFVGHDHINDYCGELYGIQLCYGRGGGHNTYGKEGFPLGARVIELSQENTKEFTSWIRLEDKSTICEQSKHEPNFTIETR